MADRHIAYVPLNDLTAADRNPKRHDVPRVTRSIAEFGYVAPVVIDERTGRLVAGHGRTQALTDMHTAGQSPPDGVRVDPDTGAWLVPTVRGWSSRSDADAAAYLVADNRHVELGGWNPAELTALLDDIGDPNLIDLTGWDPATIDVASAEGHDPDVQDVDEDEPHVPATGPAPEPVTVPGDVWALGNNRLICGDCRDYDTVARLLNGAPVNVAFTSPPYASQRTYDAASGFTPVRADEYVDWFEDVQANVRAVLADDGSWFVNIKEHCKDGQRHLYVKDLTLAHVRRWGWNFIDELCWVDKANGFPGSFPHRFKNAWEPVFHFATRNEIKFRPMANAHETTSAICYSPSTHISLDTDLGFTKAEYPPDEHEGLARPSNVIHVAAGGSGAHPAEFPVKLVAWFIRAYSDEGDVIFDPFMGAGTTMIAAEREGRVGYGVEISPTYCDVICRRYQKLTGTLPVLTATNEPHDFIDG